MSDSILTERTFVMLKPDAVRRGLIGELISWFERKGLKVVGLKMIWLNEEQAQEHYAEHRGKPFFEPLVKFVSSAPSVVMVIEGPDAVNQVRKMIGKTDCKEAQPGTIRFTYGLSKRYNLIHASDSKATAQREIKEFFSEDEIFSYDLTWEGYRM